MDDYTFITLAKLKADRCWAGCPNAGGAGMRMTGLRLEREEQRLAAPDAEVEQVETHRRSARTQSFWVGFASEPKWRQQS